MRTPVECAQQQLDAYNNRDIDPFASVYAEDVQLIDLASGSVFCSGRQALRDRYAALFLEHPSLHCELVNRIVCGTWVFDEERVTGLTENSTVHATAIYEVSNGVIQRAWFVRDSA